jgi:uncharacterized RDD family membrane protein YckC
MGFILHKSVNASNGASFGKRLLAWIIDMLIVNLVIFWPFQRLIYIYFGRLEEMGFDVKLLSGIELSPHAYFVIFIISILVMLYFSFFEYYMNQTPGKMILKLKVTYNSDASLMLAISRNIYFIPFFPFYILWVVEPLYLLFYRQTFLERLTGTLTIEESVGSIYNNYNLKKV